MKKAKENPKVKGQVHAWIGILAGGFFALLYIGLMILAVTAGAFG